MTPRTLARAAAGMALSLLSFPLPAGATGDPHQSGALSAVDHLAQAATDHFTEGTSGKRAARTALEVGGTQENLSNNLPDWTSVYLEAAHDFAPRHTLYGGLRETRRFGFKDTQAHLGLYYPLAGKWTLQLEADASNTHNVLPDYSLFGQLHRALANGWGVGAGMRRSEFTTTPVNILTGIVERYWGNFRGAYTIYNGRPEGTSSATAHRFQINYYYDERSTVGLSYTDGREVESVGPPLGLISSDIQNWTLTGRHWFARDWAVAYDLLYHEQGNLYRREGLRIGIRHGF